VAQPPHAAPLRRQPDELPGAPGEFLERFHVGVVAVAPAVAEDHDRGPPGHDVGEVLAEPPERGPVVRVGVHVQHVAAEDQLQGSLDGMLREQVGDLGRARHERERAHLPEQPLQAVHEGQGEAGRAADRQAHVGEDHEAGLVLPANDRHRPERHSVEAHAGAHGPGRIHAAAAGHPAPVSQRAGHGPGQPAQGLLEPVPFGLADGGSPGSVPFRRFNGPAVHRRERGQVVLEQLAEVRDLAA
jgi:hypothetical protein